MGQSYFFSVSHVLLVMIALYLVSSLLGLFSPWEFGSSFWGPDRKAIWVMHYHSAFRTLLPVRSQPLSTDQVWLSILSSGAELFLSHCLWGDEGWVSVPQWFQGYCLEADWRLSRSLLRQPLAILKMRCGWGCLRATLTYLDLSQFSTSQLELMFWDSHFIYLEITELDYFCVNINF